MITSSSIPSVDLLIEYAWAVSNVSNNHYNSSIFARQAWCWQTQKTKAPSSNLVTMICDDKLDPFNRLLMAYLFKNYIHHLDDENPRNSSEKKLKNAVQTMPQYKREAWDNE